LLDTLNGEYRDDPSRKAAARELLESTFLDANEQAERQHKAQLAFLAPGPHPNARQ
jgi:hypothetical protein